MSQLRSILLESENRTRVIGDCVNLVESEVASKSGLGGMAVKTAFGLIKKINPQIIHMAINKLIDDFVDAMDPFFSEYQKANASNLESHWTAKRAELADALLGVTDKRIAKAQNKTIKKAYTKLRSSGAKHVEASVPGIAQVIARYV
jgi:hypothetical protein